MHFPVGGENHREAIIGARPHQAPDDLGASGRVELNRRPPATVNAIKFDGLSDVDELLNLVSLQGDQCEAGTVKLHIVVGADQRIARVLVSSGDAKLLKCLALDGLAISAKVRAGGGWLDAAVVVP
jgi:hypothetical protein